MCVLDKLPCRQEVGDAPRRFFRRVRPDDLTPAPLRSWSCSCDNRFRACQADLVCAQSEIRHPELLNLLALCGHDALERGVARLVHCLYHADECGESSLHFLIPSSDLSIDADHTVTNLNLRS